MKSSMCTLVLVVCVRCQQPVCVCVSQTHGWTAQIGHQGAHDVLLVPRTIRCLNAVRNLPVAVVHQTDPQMLGVFVHEDGEHVRPSLQKIGPGAGLRSDHLLVQLPVLCPEDVLNFLQGKATCEKNVQSTTHTQRQQHTTVVIYGRIQHISNGQVNQQGLSIAVATARHHASERWHQGRVVHGVPTVHLCGQREVVMQTNKHCCFFFAFVILIGLITSHNTTCICKCLHHACCSPSVSVLANGDRKWGKGYAENITEPLQSPVACLHHAWLSALGAQMGADMVDDGVPLDIRIQGGGGGLDASQQPFADPDAMG